MVDKAHKNDRRVLVTQPIIGEVDALQTAVGGQCEAQRPGRIPPQGVPAQVDGGQAAGSESGEQGRAALVSDAAPV